MSTAWRQCSCEWLSPGAKRGGLHPRPPFGRVSQPCSPCPWTGRGEGPVICSPSYPSCCPIPSPGCPPRHRLEAVGRTRGRRSLRKSLPGAGAGASPPSSCACRFRAPLEQTPLERLRGPRPRQAGAALAVAQAAVEAPSAQAQARHDVGQQLLLVRQREVQVGVLKLLQVWPRSPGP